MKTDENILTLLWIMVVETVFWNRAQERRGAELAKSFEETAELRESQRAVAWLRQSHCASKITYEESHRPGVDIHDTAETMRRLNANIIGNWIGPGSSIMFATIYVSMTISS